MDKDQIEGAGRQIKGAFKEGVGTLIGDEKLKADGSAERALGNAQSSAAPGAGQLAGIDTDRIKGVGRQFRGAVEEGLGRLLGDRKLETEGAAERAAGKVQNAAGSSRDQARDAAQASRSSAGIKDTEKP
jgi:uncharacterized protein YjbJ (UPF0337 family)